MMTEFLSAFSILFLMIGTLWLLAWAVRRYGLLPGTHKIRPGEKELEIIGSQVLDPRNRLLVVRWRGSDYLLGAGSNGVTVIDNQQAGFAHLVDSAKGE